MLRDIAEALNAGGVATARGGQWHAKSVSNELQHVSVLKRTTPHQPNILAGRRWLTYWALKFPQHRLVSKESVRFDGYNHFTANIL